MHEWLERSLADVVELRRGFDLPARDRVPGPYRVLSAGAVAGWHNVGPVKGPGFVVGRATNLGRPTWSSEDFWPLNTVLYAADFKGNDPRFLFHLFESIDLTGFDSGSVQPMLNRNYIAGVRVKIPSLGAQRAIAEVLGALDDKIAANSRSSSLLDEVALAHLVHALSVGSKKLVVRDVADFHNRRRVPLSSREREMRKGAIPYYGAAGRIGFVDQAIFNEILILVGEDGSVIRDDGSPVLQYVWGESWVNNHAHVLTGRGISTELLKLVLSRANVSHLVTGAVQPKLNMKNLQSLAVEIPSDLTAVDEFAVNCGAAVRALTDESSVLERTRDELLPLLMSGKLRVKDAEQIVEEIA
ncbi:restriction endonuclease subunit S [Nocardia cyriacigeorgica]|jgi:type I restriction enzyme, S subunit|uniref:restriction endonuclease subunit S n=1 Tax=Nocardia cyriacigeorgica TaxID=135487 RepID=UPI000CEA2854|nr:restriction endonuclease subunit S [Nocardia cyriacigeorgica]PPJ06391.1 hypothetical protein C5E43_20440 [Nocardia cyriacigeorgica]